MSFFLCVPELQCEDNTCFGVNVLLCPDVSFNVPICPDKGKKGRKILVQMVNNPYL